MSYKKVFGADTSFFRQGGLTGRKILSVTYSFHKDRNPKMAGMVTPYESSLIRVGIYWRICEDYS